MLNLEEGEEVEDRELADAWRVFAEDDARAEAPEHVRLAVLAGWDAADAHQATSEPVTRHGTLAVVALAAAAVLLAVGLVVRDARVPGAAATMPRQSAPPAITFSTELLQIVRVRVPRMTLRALGVPLLDPEASGIVEVDVLVGEDGFPLDIRGIRPVADSGAGE